MNKSFTLIEILIVIVVIGILSAFVLVGMNSITESANIAKGKAFSDSLRNSLLTSLVSEWKLDEGAGSNTVDSWGINNGTLTNGPTWVTSNCISNNCLSFDGDNDYINCGNNSSLSMGAKDHTTSFWIKLNNNVAPDTETHIFCGGVVGVSSGYWIRRQTGGSSLYLCFNDGSPSRLEGSLSGNGTLIANKWYYVVVTFDRDGMAQGYIDGKIQTGYSLVSRPGNIQNTYSFQLGGYGGSYLLDGFLDEVKIYNAILSSIQIQQNYYVGLNKLFKNNGIISNEFNQRIGELKSNLSNNE